MPLACALSTSSVRSGSGVGVVAGRGHEGGQWREGQHGGGPCAGTVHGCAPSGRGGGLRASVAAADCASVVAADYASVVVAGGAADADGPAPAVEPRRERAYGRPMDRAAKVF
ncbi:hypothetical protein GCM10018785_46890 [Streptomyces longispororuber]|uniref:Uncharacterized protein n=1 Tax=Streptomyces longispororuber TaxID=68230 RepID=A0A919DR22_9ACTN|nr:hypothetical protein GCM10018785_46890 [Streptomyces longispororuber]